MKRKKKKMARKPNVKAKFNKFCLLTKSRKTKIIYHLLLPKRKYRIVLNEKFMLSFVIDVYIVLFYRGESLQYR